MMKKKYIQDDGDISAYYIQDCIPTNDMIFGMTEVTNVLTTRTV